MLTLLPEPDYKISADVLDDRRLGKQRVEVLQILNALHEISNGWRNHPAVKMWSQHEPQLCEYGLVICEVWKARGFKDTCYTKIEQHLDWCTAGDYSLEKPKWFGDKCFHLSHRSNLIRKDPLYYSELWPDVPNNLPYVWPV